MRSIQHSFAAGEFSDELYGRSDLEQYDLGAKLLQNFEVNYGGGAFKRKGLRFGEYLHPSAFRHRFFPFKFSNDLNNTYLVIFGDGTIRFFKEGAYVLESSKAVSTVLAGVVHSTAHGYSGGDLVYLANRPDLFRVTTTTTNTFGIKVQATSDDATFSGGATTVRRVFTLEHPYSEEHLPFVGYSQYLNDVRFTHPEYPVHILTRTSSSWTMGEETITAGAPLNQAPSVQDSGAYILDIRVTAYGDAYAPDDTVTVSGGGGTGFKGKIILGDPPDDASPEGNQVMGVTIVKNGTGFTSVPTVVFSGGTGAEAEATLVDTNAGFIVGVTAVFADGRESGISRPGMIRDSIDFTQTRGSATYEWNAVTGAVAYNVYRSIVIPDGEKMHLGYQMGYIGTSRGTKFTDDNIIPDFTRTPRVYKNPFVSGAVDSIRVLTEGSGYSDGTNLSLSGGGSGFVGYPVVQEGKIIGVHIAHHGEGYTAPATITTTSDGGGTGATFSVTLTEEDGNYPAVAARFQQRFIYAGTKNEPMTIWGSRPRELNFAESEIITPADPYEYTIDSDVVDPIRHALAVQQGLLLFTAAGVVTLRASDGDAVTPTSGFIDPNSFVGANHVRPQLVQNDILYIQDRHTGLEMLRLDQTGRKFFSNELSILARHLFDGREIGALAFAYATTKRGYGLRSDGTGFSVTVDRDQNLYAFGRLSTRGKLLDVVAIGASGAEHLYFLTERTLGNRTVKMVEFMRPEDTTEPEDGVYLDACISIPKVKPAATLTPSAAVGVITVEADSPVFASGDVGKVLGLGGGRGIVTGFSSSTEVQVTITRRITDTGDIPSGQWWLNPLVEEVSNIPYEGATVDVVGDGQPQNSKVVVDGSISLDRPAAIVHVGLAYEATLETLPLTAQDDVLEGWLIATNEVRVKFRRAGMFKIGGYDAPLRTDEALIEPTRQDAGERWVTQSSGWGPGGEITITATAGMPLEILQVVHDIDRGSRD